MDQEIKDYIDKKIEGLYLSLTEIVGSAMAHQAFCNKINAQFYKAHPEFKDKKDVVASVVEVVDSENPGEEYEKILAMSVPKIHDRIALAVNMNMTSVQTAPTRDFSAIGGGE